ncbi:MAG: ECF transporter S component [Clostridia bacterium]|nr:ECF transporter S component [Clostridia bacterium]
MNTSKRKQSVLHMVELAVLTAIVMVLQMTGAVIRIPFLGTSVSLVLIPIALGAMLLGPAAGAWLGFVFGAITYIMGGVMGMDLFTLFLFQDHPLITAAICFVKSTLAGYLGGLVYRLLKEKKPLLAVFLCAMLIPVVNTGVFVLGCLVILGTIEGYIAAVGLTGTSALYFIFILCAGINFLVEFAVNTVFSPALKRVIDIVTRRLVR